MHPVGKRVLGFQVGGDSGAPVPPGGLFLLSVPEVLSVSTVKWASLPAFVLKGL